MILRKQKAWSYCDNCQLEISISISIKSISFKGLINRVHRKLSTMLNMRLSVNSENDSIIVEETELHFLLLSGESFTS